MVEAGYTKRPVYIYIIWSEYKGALFDNETGITRNRKIYVFELIADFR